MVCIFKLKFDFILYFTILYPHISFIKLIIKFNHYFYKNIIVIKFYFIEYKFFSNIILNNF